MAPVRVYGLLAKRYALVPTPPAGLEPFQLPPDQEGLETWTELQMTTEPSELTHQVVHGCGSEGHSDIRRYPFGWLVALTEALLRNGPITLFSLGMKWEGIQDIQCCIEMKSGWFPGPSGPWKVCSLGNTLKG